MCTWSRSRSVDVRMYNNTTWHIFTFAVSIAALCLITFFAVVCCCCCSCVFHEHQPHREGGYDETQQTYILYYFHNIIPRRIFIYFILHIIFLLYICHGRLCFHPPFLCWNVFFCIPHSLTVSDVKQWMLFFFSHFGHDSSIHNRHNTQAKTITHAWQYACRQFSRKCTQISVELLVYHHSDCLST